MSFKILEHIFAIIFLICICAIIIELSAKFLPTILKYIFYIITGTLFILFNIICLVISFPFVMILYGVILWEEFYSYIHYDNPLNKI